MIINSPSYDWITVTSFSPTDAMKLWKLHNSITGGTLHESVNRIQYLGTLIEHEHGSSYWGEGVQRGFAHFILQVSSRLSHEIRQLIYDYYQSFEMARVTRLDLQLTIKSEYDQTALFNELKANNSRANVAYIESKGKTGTLATVYLGKRNSQRVIRVYNKEFNGDRYYRLEVETKGQLAPAIYKHTGYGLDAAKMAGVMRYEIEKIGNGNLSALFIPFCDTEPIHVKPDKTESNRHVWLTETIFPLIAKEIATNGDMLLLLELQKLTSRLTRYVE